MLTPAWALWYSHRPESRPDSRYGHGRPTPPKCKPEAKTTCSRHAWTIPDAARARRTKNAGLGQHRPQSTHIFSSRRRSPRATRCMRPCYVLVLRHASGFAPIRAVRGVLSNFWVSAFRGRIIAATGRLSPQLCALMDPAPCEPASVIAWTG